MLSLETNLCVGRFLRTLFYWSAQANLEMSKQMTLMMQMLLTAQQRQSNNTNLNTEKKYHAQEQREFTVIYCITDENIYSSMIVEVYNSG